MQGQIISNEKAKLFPVFFSENSRPATFCFSLKPKHHSVYVLHFWLNLKARRCLESGSDLSLIWPNPGKKQKSNFLRAIMDFLLWPLRRLAQGRLRIFILSRRFLSLNCNTLKCIVLYYIFNIFLFAISAVKTLGARQQCCKESYRKVRKVMGNASSCIIITFLIFRHCFPHFSSNFPQGRTLSRKKLRLDLIIPD